MKKLKQTILSILFGTALIAGVGNAAVQTINSTDPLYPTSLSKINANFSALDTAITTFSSFPFTSTSNYGEITAATSTPIWGQAGIFASSTSRFVNASSTLFSATRFYGADGTAGSPSYTFTSAPTNGMYYAGGNTLALSSNGLQIATLSTSLVDLITDTVSFTSSSDVTLFSLSQAARTLTLGERQSIFSIVTPTGTADDPAGDLSIVTGDGAGDRGGNIVIESGSGGVTDGDGGNITIASGEAADGYAAGHVTLTAGEGGTGGDVLISTLGSTFAGVQGGSIYLNTGGANGARAGDMNLTLGSASGNNAGNFNLTVQNATSRNFTFIGDTGNVGIGTTSPYRLFSVNGPAFMGSTTMARSDSGAVLELQNTVGGTNVTLLDLVHKDVTPSDFDESRIDYYFNNDALTRFLFVRQNIYAEDVTAGTEDSAFDFQIRSGGSLRTILSVGTNALNGIQVGSGSATGIVASLSNQDLTLQTGNVVTGSITIEDGSNGNILLMPNGSGSIGIGTTTPRSQFHIASTTTGTTTMEVGDQFAATNKACFNTKNTVGTAISFYFVGTSMVVENNRCK